MHKFEPQFLAKCKPNLITIISHPTPLSIMLGIWILLLVNYVLAIHAPGYCAMYDNCGKKSFFGAELPCPANVKAVEPDLDTKQLLTSICGAEFPTDQICCSKDQLVNLQSNLKRVDPLISSCPACRKNFYDFFCEFTCSPDQLMFVNITDTIVAMDTKKEIVSELTQYIEPKTASKFFDSCKNLKFSATNSYAMDLIGGGAKNFGEFLKFLGDEKPLLGGSPFQMNFEYEIDKSKEKAGLSLRSRDMKPCNDEVYKCACSDCLESCPELPKFNGLDQSCTVAGLPCFTFALLIGLLTFILAVGGFHIYIAKSKKTRSLLLGDENDETIENEIQLYTYLVQKKDQTSNYLSSVNKKLLASIETGFERLGFFAASCPGFTILCSVFFIVLLSLGMKWLVFETNPVNLWVSPDEPHLKNYEYFEDNFGEWYRIEQIFVSRKDGSPILDWETIQWWFESELSLQSFEDGNETLSLDDFCFKPLGETCAIQSFSQYFYGNIDFLNEKNWQKQIKDCTESPVNCLPSFQQPLKKNILFSQDEVLESKAFVVTIIVNSDLKNKEYTEKVEKYEEHLKDWLLKLGHDHPNYKIDFSTEISLTQELNKSTNTDVNIVIVSYIMMFLYASIALGGHIPTKFQLKSLSYTRFELGLSGIVIILCSVTSSLGFFALIGLKSTLIIAEVIPFLVLAIGIDNIFLIVHELRAVNETEDLKYKPLEIRIGKALGRMGPSCMNSAILQISMFLLATNVDMPAVKNFAFYSAGAIFVNFVLQMTCFISLLKLDQQRLEDGRLDILFWMKSLVSIPEGETGAEASEMDYLEYNFGKLIQKFYAPKILKKTAKPKILTFFILWFGVSLSLLPYIDLGLDQKIALPKDSYLVDYFESMANYLNVGPPVFFVVKNTDLSDRDYQQKVCGKFSTCAEFSLLNVLEQEYKRADKSTIVDPLSNWLDDFLTWLNPNLDQCCRKRKNSDQFCSPTAPERMCEVCYENHDPPYNIDMSGLPQGDEFMYYFNDWIEEPSDPCPLGGKAPHGHSVSYNESLIISSYFRTSHGPLRTQKDFINGFKNSLRVVEEVKEYQDLDLFAFSPFYIFFVQYESIVKLTFTLLAIAMAIIGLISIVLLGSIKSAAVLVLTVILILVNIGGILAIWDVSLNAVSLVNLIICAGLAVEFCIHIVKGYTDAKGNIEEEDESNDVIYNDFMNNSDGLKNQSTVKAYHALVNIGGSVLGGITLTKFIGIIVLAFTRSKIFEVYYFRMWLSLIFIAAIHALCLLPILLSYI